MASHITTDGHIVPPLNITKPAPFIDLRGFQWTTVDHAINTAQRLEKDGLDPVVDGAPQDHEQPVQTALLMAEVPHLLSHAANGGPPAVPQPPSQAPQASIQPGAHLPAQLPAQLGIKAGVPEPPPPEYPIAKFQGAYAGNGFNTIFRPRSGVSKEDHEKNSPNQPADFPNKPINLGTFPNGSTPPDDNILELNLTTEQLTFGDTIGRIPNRGLQAQKDIDLAGLPYLQTVQDVTNPLSGRGDRIIPDPIHFELGMWLKVPESGVNTKTGPSIARMASIPHGTTINAQCLIPAKAQTTSGATPGPPNIDARDITPFAGTLKFAFPSMFSKNKSAPRIPQIFFFVDAFNKAGTITDDIIQNPTWS